MRAARPSQPAAQVADGDVPGRARADRGVAEEKWSARRIHLQLSSEDISVAVCTITRILRRQGLARLRDLDVDGEVLRAPGKITARYPGHMIHLDVKKVGRIPHGGGWRIHGRGSDADRARHKAPRKRGAKVGYATCTRP